MLRLPHPLFHLFNFKAVHLLLAVDALLILHLQLLLLSLQVVDLVLPSFIFEGDTHLPVDSRCVLVGGRGEDVRQRICGGVLVDELDGLFQLGDFVLVVCPLRFLLLLQKIDLSLPQDHVPVVVILDVLLLGLQLGDVGFQLFNTPLELSTCHSQFLSQVLCLKCESLILHLHSVLFLFLLVLQC